MGSVCKSTGSFQDLYLFLALGIQAESCAASLFPIHEWYSIHGD